jgi:hypothetical protein
MPTGQYWTESAAGGYMYSDELSDVLRNTLQPTCIFRQFCEPREADKEYGTGERFYWNVYGDASQAAEDLAEREPMPETDFTIAQSYLTISEGGMSIPYTFKLEAMAKHDVVSVVEKKLGDNARKYFDAKVYLQFDATPLRVVPTSGTSTTALTLDTDGVTAVTNNIELGSEHVNLIEDLMRERNIPAYTGNDYLAISRPSTWRPLKDDLEAKHIYTEKGLGMVFEGEKGKYSGVRFIDQTWIPVGGAEDSTTFNAYTATGDAWNNAKSSWAFFFGADTVLECVVIAEEVRAKIPSDFGRSKGIAWYWLGGFGLVHTDATNARILKWDSAA